MYVFLSSRNWRTLNLEVVLSQLHCISILIGIIQFKSYCKRFAKFLTPFIFWICRIIGTSIHHPMHKDKQNNGYLLSLYKSNIEYKYTYTLATNHLGSQRCSGVTGYVRPEFNEEFFDAFFELRKFIEIPKQASVYLKLMVANLPIMKLRRRGDRKTRSSGSRKRRRKHLR